MSLSNQELLEKLPSLKEALKLPKPQFNKWASGIANYSHYCDWSFLPEKFTEWCTYLDCSKGVCNYFNKKRVDITTTSVPLTTLAYPDHCFDMWFCPPDWSANTTYISQAIICLPLLVVTLILTLVFIPSFVSFPSKPANVTTRILLTIMAVYDIILLVLSIHLFCVPFAFRTYADQLELYSQYVARTVPIFVPLWEMCFSLSLWTLMLLLLEQYLYQTQGNHARLLFTKKVLITFISFLFVVIFMLTVLKMFAFSSVKYADGTFHVEATEYGKKEYVHNLITNWLKVPLEYFGPLLSTSILLVMCCSSVGTNQKNSTLMSENNKKYKSFKGSIKSFIYLNQSIQEERIFIGIVVLSTLSVVLKMPEFVHHILKNESAHIDTDIMFMLQLSGRITSIIFLFCKPLVYAFFTPEYCKSCTLFCLNYFPKSFKSVDSSPDATGRPVALRSFEDTVTNQMRQSISYRDSVWASSYNRENSSDLTQV